ncbi:MAG: hypothetical protein ACOX4I_02180 [Anaerovoracaceae bacterium]|jgi:hypothetical protein
MDTQIRALFAGNIVFIICIVFYLLWWGIAFRPPGGYHGSAGTAVLLVCALIAGLAGTIMSVRALMHPAGEAVNRAPHGWMIGLAGVVIYAVLLLVSSRLLHRQVTTELLLIVAWGVLQICIICAAYRAGGIGRGSALALAVLILAMAVISLLCYLKYYGLPERTGYYVGMVPLILALIGMACVNAVMAH